MSILICDNVSVAYGADVILKKINFSINAGDKVGVIGVNGAGKSTLFSVIRGKLESTKGDVFVSAGSEIGVLEQINDAHRFNCSIFNAAVSAFTPLLDLEIKIADLQARIEAGDESLVKSFVDYTERFNTLGGNEFRAKTKSMLLKFGFSEED
ncbi:MAG: ABC-F family ATP-binding cassette domain-containing protein, partial [Clostridia bacterium]|nr:ABC-F family ATP-binding cassette domain-containing protein [Clostridia bacterium]